ncbi:MAG TPA: hypothetical protein VLU25_02055, partial [Acidobacteriota bacterium]|nr:hypothetical protein [Acidobacteriota bacterium]
MRFLLVGAHAVGFWAEPRATGDLDVLIDPTPENAGRVMAALKMFGAPLHDLTEEDLTSPGTVYQMGLPPVRIDILNSVSGVSFEEAWDGHGRANFGDLEISRPALIR